MAQTGFLTRTISNVRDMLDEPDTNAKWTDAKIIKYIEAAYAMVFSDLNRGQQNPLLVPYDITSTTSSEDMWYDLPPTVGAIPQITLLDSGGNYMSAIDFHGLHNPYGQGIKVMHHGLFIKKGAVPTGNQIRVEYVPSGTARLHEGTTTNNIGATRTAHATYCTTTVIVFLNVNYLTEFPVGSWIKNSASTTWHQVSSVAMGNGGDGDGNDDTVVTMATAATSSWDGLTIQAFYNDRLVLMATPTVGALDNRSQAYAGSILRILGTDGGHDFVSDRVVDTYNNTTRIAMLLWDWQTGPSGTVTYEMAPMMDSVLDLPISMYVSKVIAGIEGDNRRVVTIGGNYREMMRTLRLTHMDYHGYMGNLFRGDTVHNAQYRG